MEDLDMIYNTTDGKTMAGGYSVNSILLNEQQPAIYNNSQLGGKKESTNKVSANKESTNKVSERFKHLAVPAGLLYINDSTNNNRTTDRTDETSIIDDELYEKLLALAQHESIKTKSHTRSKKQSTKHKKKKTKRNVKVF